MNGFRNNIIKYLMGMMLLCVFTLKFSGVLNCSSPKYTVTVEKETDDDVKDTKEEAEKFEKVPFECVLSNSASDLMPITNTIVRKQALYITFELDEPSKTVLTPPPDLFA